MSCSKFIAGKCADAKKLLHSLVDVAANDPYVALCLYGSYCRLTNLAQATLSSLVASLKPFDEEVRRYFASCISWTQAQLSLGFHICADNVHLQQAIIQFNDQISTSDAITAEVSTF